MKKESFTEKAKKNFQISSIRVPKSFKKALGLIKKAAAQVNASLGQLDKKKAQAIVKAAEEFIDGKYDAEFDLDVYQAGAGTPFNMNANEIIAERAGVHPNDDVNRAQSSNDVIPTAICIAALWELDGMVKEGEKLAHEFQKKAEEFSKMIKVGRTHLQDAVPVTLGQEFSAYASALEHALERVELVSKELEWLGIGGTATGSGINTHPLFAQKMCSVLSDLSWLKLHSDINKFECSNSMASFLSVSAALRGLAASLLRICDDLRLMASGPVAGFNEITLPEVEPGSSIMPGKVNPSILEAMSMICVQVIGLDTAICTAAQRGQLELNWYTPLIMWDLLHQIEILTNGMSMMNKFCVRGIAAHEKHMKETLEKSAAMATALAPILGYDRVAQMVQEAKKRRVPFSSLVPMNYQKLLHVKNLTRPNR